MKFHTNCLQQPVILFLKNGKMFSMVDEKTNVETNFFCIVSIKGQMITLMKLIPCYVCLTKFNLKPTYQYVLMDCSTFCGYHIIEDACIHKCEHPYVCFIDRFCKSFSIVTGHDEIVLWRSNVNGHQSGILQLSLEELDSFAEIIMYNETGFSRYPLCSNTYFLNQCKQISIISNTAKRIKGVFTIEMNTIVECE